MRDLADALRGIDNGSVEIKGGERYFHYGYFQPKPKQKPKRCILIVQRYLVREALAQNIPLLNKKLTAFKTHTITFSGTQKARSIYAKTANVEAQAPN
jgi:hypothetical protein